ncbi:flavin-containing monooxygenase [Antrihabitans cavernicola]|uniref:NAD(P)/FAD-dependent oxidoreductase n=1 Tax=Antrihabitans cavernicola TaxID=2495913 RepID=A0A5A7S6C3_9NOCA|nr:NAD(P)/FAD-dependent oxidoreductase [Spelaeibacter cavernicola]KAA0021660.1 NAD(P)/FAD-dependent oxidoreductase [Spelaeibacter cavernicola]
MSSAQPSVIIIGAGFGGLAMALQLQRSGFDRFTILEKGESVGGVWRENTYPGAGCDIPSPLYSFSYEPNPVWPKRFSMQPDILQYLKDVSGKRGVTPKIRFGTEVTSAEFDAGAAHWRVYTADGVEHHADVLVNAVGQLSRPAMPNIPGVESFAGASFHSAEWDHSVDLTGKRVAVIGTGASAIQLVPAIQPDVEQLTLFQRSAAWVVPKPDVEYKPWHHAMFRMVPPTRLFERFAIWGFCEMMSLGLVDVPAIRPLVARAATHHLHKQVTDPALREALTPDYAPGCKRALFSNDYFPALAQPNAAVITESIAEITPTGVRTADGTVHEADVIVYSTGFKTNEFLAPMTIVGTDGAALADEWRGGARAYLGMTVPKFPNMFVMYGPNTNLGVGSIVYMLESQARYIAELVKELAERPGTYIDVKADVEERFDAEIQRRLGKSVWTLCSSWYRDAAGRIPNNWPGTVTSYRRRTRKPDLGDFAIHSKHEHRGALR